jgi:hypothetical protein
LGPSLGGKVPSRIKGLRRVGQELCLLSKIQANRKEEDVFPARYRCNSKGKIRRYLEKYGFEGCVFGFEAEPSYLSFSRMNRPGIAGDSIS